MRGRREVIALLRRVAVVLVGGLCVVWCGRECDLVCIGR
jgi:hypothetical protein